MGLQSLFRSVRERLTVFALVTGFGVAAGVAAAGPTALVTVKSTQNSALGKILVNASGKTLYHYSSEAKNAVKCTGTCAKTWPSTRRSRKKIQQHIRANMTPRHVASKIMQVAAIARTTSSKSVELAAQPATQAAGQESARRYPTWSP